MKKIHKKIIALQAAKFDAMAKHAKAPRLSLTRKVVNGNPVGRNHNLYSKHELTQINNRYTNGRTIVDATRILEKKNASKRAAAFRAFAWRYERSSSGQEPIDNWSGANYAFKNHCLHCLDSLNSPLPRVNVIGQHNIAVLRTTTNKESS